MEHVYRIEKELDGYSNLYFVDTRQYLKRLKISTTHDPTADVCVASCGGKVYNNRIYLGDNITYDYKVYGATYAYMVINDSRVLDFDNSGEYFSFTDINIYSPMFGRGYNMVYIITDGTHYSCMDLIFMHDNVSRLFRHLRFLFSPIFLERYNKVLLLDTLNTRSYMVDATEISQYQHGIKRRTEENYNEENKDEYIKKKSRNMQRFIENMELSK